MRRVQSRRKRSERCKKKKIWLLFVAVQTKHHSAASYLITCATRIAVAVRTHAAIASPTPPPPTPNIMSILFR